MQMIKNWRPLQTSTALSVHHLGQPKTNPHHLKVCLLVFTNFFSKEEKVCCHRDEVNMSTEDAMKSRNIALILICLSDFITITSIQLTVKRRQVNHFNVIFENSDLSPILTLQSSSPWAHIICALSGRSN